jgi:N-methylhydantoinase B/oxoprolinase/acetone carboxylase alpha subunit
MSFILARTAVAARGLEGGGPGALASLTRNGQTIGHTEPIVLQPGDVIRIALSGGGGFGTPREHEA